jgi:hypothetical protein
MTISVRNNFRKSFGAENLNFKDRDNLESYIDYVTKIQGDYLNRAKNKLGGKKWFNEEIQRYMPRYSFPKNLDRNSPEYLENMKNVAEELENKVINLTQDVGRHGVLADIREKWKPTVGGNGDNNDYNRNRSIDSIIDQGRKILAADREKLNSLPYQSFGSKQVEMSPLNLKKQEIERANSNKAPSYSKSVNSVLNRKDRGFSPEQINNLVNSSNEQNRERSVKSENNFKKYLGERWLTDAGFDVLRQKMQKDMNKIVEPHQRNLNEYSKELAQKEKMFSNTLAGELQNMGSDKTKRRNIYTDMLGQLGALEENHGEMRNKAKEERLKAEASIPYKKLSILESALNNVNYDEDQPESERAAEETLKKTIAAYKTPHASFAGELIEDLPDEHRLAKEYILNEDFKGNNRDERKNLRKGLVNKASLADRSLNEIDSDVRYNNVNLDEEGKKLLKRSLSSIGARHRALGGYGSGAHTRETMKAMRKILQEQNLKNQNSQIGAISNKVRSNEMADLNELNRLRQLENISNNNFANRMNDISSLNRSSINNWSNKQRGLNKKISEFENQQNWEFPQLRGNYEASNRFVDPNSLNLDRLRKNRNLV